MSDTHSDSKSSGVAARHREPSMTTWQLDCAGRVMRVLWVSWLAC